MKRLKRLSSLTTVSVLTVSALLNIGFAPAVNAAADTCTWTGAGVVDNFNDAANWTGCDNGALPEAGDTLEFGTLSGNPSVNLNNDLGFAFAGIRVTATSGGSTIYTINTLTIQNNGIINDLGTSDSDTTSVNLTAFTAQGDLTVNGGTNNISFPSVGTTITGVVTLEDGASFDGMIVGSNGVIVQRGTQLSFFPNSTTETVPTYPITLGGGVAASDPLLVFSGYGLNDVMTTWTLANPITLLGNALVEIQSQNVTVNQTGSITGPGFVLGLHEDSVEGSTLVISPSSNNSATIAGSYNGQGAYGAGPGSSAPGTPDTGFALAANNPVVSVVLIVAAAGGIALIARRLQTSSSKSHK